jgi:hypothetical protein
MVMEDAAQLSALIADIYDAASGEAHRAAAKPACPAHP